MFKPPEICSTCGLASAKFPKGENQCSALDSEVNFVLLKYRCAAIQALAMQGIGVKSIDELLLYFPQLKPSGQ